MHELWIKYLEKILDQPSAIFDPRGQPHLKPIHALLKKSALQGQLDTIAILTISQALLADQRISAMKEKLSQSFWNQYYCAVICIFIFMTILSLSSKDPFKIIVWIIFCFVLILSFFLHLKLINQIPKNWLLNMDLTAEGNIWLGGILDSQGSFGDRDLQIKKHQEWSSRKTYECEVNLSDFKRRFQIYHFLIMAITASLAAAGPLLNVLNDLVK